MYLGRGNLAWGVAFLFKIANLCLQLVKLRCRRLCCFLDCGGSGASTTNSPFHGLNRLLSAKILPILRDNLIGIDDLLGFLSIAFGAFHRFFGLFRGKIRCVRLAPGILLRCGDLGYTRLDEFLFLR